ncbi:MAG: MazG nucleotide pyrophosphohydrolase domain-containing protein [Patescibacteria group bacterium]
MTLKELCEYIKKNDFQQDRKHSYLMKLVEEVGELSQMIRKVDFKKEKCRLADTGQIKDTLDEELYDVLYYVLALANLYDVDLEECFRLKEEYNKSKYKHE